MTHCFSLKERESVFHTATTQTFDLFNKHLFSPGAHQVGFIITDAGEESNDAEEEMLWALQEPELDHQTEVNISIDDDDWSAIVMLLAMLMLLPHANIVGTTNSSSSEPGYVEISDNESPAITDTITDTIAISKPNQPKIEVEEEAKNLLVEVFEGKDLKAAVLKVMEQELECLPTVMLLKLPEVQVVRSFALEVVMYNPPPPS
ncbi:uncharacterized protein EV420DRAFT_1649200 [Desarmillaria tabescens]|uniref:Uncharacterized protein n=1 Tax=Armillaria tabescens TaxID=1929756 RepID=A0AA39JJM1_ARMTA|nr:uncharacterized protein EV420DRAFT_1649200 [Desarmillaria tabescens]KAK0443412.1 hypothetical protein EV420DRAFT_1649200 [Desarmillaria tabescens]